MILIYNHSMQDFLDFIKKQGVVGLATGFILGGAVSKLVSALVSDIINPFLSVLVGLAGGLKDATFIIGPIEILYGHFISTLIDFLVIAAVVYFLVRLLSLDIKAKKTSPRGKIGHAFFLSLYFFCLIFSTLHYCSGPMSCLCSYRWWGHAFGSKIGY